jgi:DNA-binding NtrC family response regulator
MMTEPGPRGVLMAGETILYVSDQVADSNLVLAGIDAAGYDVVSTNSSNQALALFFIMNSAAAVILDLRAKEEIGIEFARKLRAVHSGVPIILRCCEHIDHLPSWVDAYVSVGEPLEKLTSVLRTLLNEEPAIHECRLSDSLPRS